MRSAPVLVFPSPITTPRFGFWPFPNKPLPPVPVQPFALVSDQPAENIDTLTLAGASGPPLISQQSVPAACLPVFTKEKDTLLNIGQVKVNEEDYLQIISTKGGPALKLNVPKANTTFYVFPGGLVKAAGGSFVTLWPQTTQIPPVISPEIHIRPLPTTQSIADTALIAAGGDASRFQPLSKEKSKVVAPTDSRHNTLIGRSGKMLRDIGIRNIVVTTRVQPEKIKKAMHCVESSGVNVRYFKENAPKGDIGALLDMLKEPKKWGINPNKPLLIVNGDSYSNIDYTHLLKTHTEKNALLTMGSIVVPDDETKYFGISVTDQSDPDGQSGVVTGFKEKPQPNETSSRLANTANIVLSPQAMALLPQIWEKLGKPQKFNLCADAIPVMVEMTRQSKILNDHGHPMSIWAQAVKGQWVDVGRPSVYFQIHKNKTPQGAIVWPGAKLHPADEVQGNVVVSPLVAA